MTARRWRAPERIDRWEALLLAFGTELYLVARDPELPGSDLRARMFAPNMGIVEDPATGAAVAALGGFLGVPDSTKDGTLRWVVEQGFEMGRPSPPSPSRRVAVRPEPSESAAPRRW